MKNSLKTIDQAFDYIGSFMNFENNLKQTIRDYRIDRMDILLRHFGNPEYGLHFIHISGSKGKGSTGAFISAGLAGLGIDSGLYTSPHVVSYKERITGNGRFFPDTVYLELIREIADGLEDFHFSHETGCTEPTTFELLTLLSFMVFRREKYLWAVIETGIGGRLDATNIISPVASIITTIELEHTDILGSTIEEIAFEKAGIIKPGVPVFCGYLSPAAEKIIVDTAREKKSPVFLLREQCQSFRTSMEEGRMRIESASADGTTDRFFISMTGDFQAENALMALMVLKEVFLPNELEKKTMLSSLKEAVLPGRMEKISDNPPIVIDAAHTRTSVRRAAAAFLDLYHENSILIFGAVKRKDIAGMVNELVSLFRTIIISTPNKFKESDPIEVYRLFRNASETPESVFLKQDPGEALLFAESLCNAEAKADISKKKAIFVTGSFYMICEFRRLRVHEKQREDHNVS